MSSRGKCCLKCSLKDGSASVNQNGAGKSITSNGTNACKGPTSYERGRLLKLCKKSTQHSAWQMVVGNNANDDDSGEEEDGEERLCW